MSISLVPRDSKATRRPDETLELRGEWQLPSMPKVIEARLFWYTSGKGTEDVGIIATRPVAPAPSGSQSFKFRLPEAPYSFSGRLITIQWAVELVADSEVARWEFTLSPSGSEVRLNSEASLARR
jgi:hypothetical protein